VIRAIRKVCPNVLIRTIGPNNDLGHRGILAAYEQEKKHLMLEMSIEQKVFWGALILGGILVGNSSSGIIEAATFGCAVVNIGDRQAGRERNENVIDVGWNAREIEAGILKGMRDEKFLKTVSRRRNIYGDGSASGKIVRILEGIATAGGMTLEKRFADR
jgi:UDP-N-acetylglucosamine 2-epimerase